MAGEQRAVVRITEVSVARARPRSADELHETISMLVNAAQGTHGYGEFDGGVGGAGYWTQAGVTWAFQLDVAAVCGITITLPYSITKSVVRIYDITTGQESLQFVEDSATIDVTLNGRTIVSASNILSGK